MQPLVIKVEDVATEDAWVYVFDESPVILGRGEGATLQLARPFVSQTHGSFAFDDARATWTYADLDSASGTSTEGRRLGAEEIVALTPDARLVIGSLALTVLFAPPAARPAIGAESPFAAGSRAARAGVPAETVPLSAVAAAALRRAPAPMTASAPPATAAAPAPGATALAEMPPAPPPAVAPLGPPPSAVATTFPRPASTALEQAPPPPAGPFAGATMHLPEAWQGAADQDHPDGRPDDRPDNRPITGGTRFLPDADAAPVFPAPRRTTRTRPISRSEPRPSRSRRVLIAAGALALTVGAAGATTFALMHRSPSPPEPALDTPAAEATRPLPFAPPPPGPRAAHAVPAAAPGASAAAASAAAASAAAAPGPVAAPRPERRTSPVPHARPKLAQPPAPAPPAAAAGPPPRRSGNGALILE